MSNTRRSTSWFISRLLFPVAFTAAFFVTVGVPSALAQSRVDRPDLRITKASFNGRDLHVEYTNATGVYDRRRYEVGLQWYDASGRPVGERHWLPQPEVERGGVAILDTKYRINLTYRRSGGNYNRRLLDFILQRPNTAEELRITVDDGDRIPETDETNNVASLRIPLPDLQITGAKFLSPNRLELSYRNANPSPIPLPFRIGFTWAEEGGAYANATRWINVLEPAAGATETVVLSRTDASYLTPQNRQAGDRLDWYFERRPGNATRLKITIDDAGTVREQNEQNNLVTARPFLPDIVVERITIVDGQPQATIWNRGEGSAQSAVVAHEYRDRAGKALGGGSRDVAPLGLGPDFKIIAAILGTVPDGAVAIRVTVDPANAVVESNEQNNVQEGPAPMADLAIGEAKIALGTLALTYRNAGHRKADPVSIWLHFADASSTQVGPLYWMDVSPIRAGGTQVLKNETKIAYSSAGAIELTNLIASPPAGATHLKVLLDGPNRIVEANEQNNVALFTMPVIPLPDLAISDLTIGKDVITWKEKNLGDTVHGSFSYLTTIAWLDANGKTLSDRSPQTATATILVGSVSTEEMSTRFGAPASFLTPPAGAVKLRASIDPKGTVTEKNEENNAVEVKVETKLELPDLAFTNVFLVPPKRERLVIGFQNAGKVAAPEFSWAMSWVDAAGKRVGTPYEGVVPALKPSWRFGVGSDVQELDPKGKPVPRGKWLRQPKPDGAARLEITIDPGNAIAESDEANNRQTFDEWVPPKPAEPEKRADLRIAEFTMDPVTPRAGERVWFVVRVENVGSAATGTQTATGIIVDPEKSGTDRKLIGQFTAADIPSGKSFTHRWTKENYYGWVAVAGTHTIEVCADRAGVVTEGDETNNCAQRVVTVAALVDEQPKLPDLSVGAVEVKDGALRIVAKNTGGEASTPTDIWLMWFAGGRALSSSAAVDLPAIAAGKETTVIVTLDGKVEASQILSTPPKDGTRVRIFLDGSRKVKEMNEDNNDTFFDRAALPAPTPVTTKPSKSDLVVEQVFVLPSKPTANTQIEFAAIIRNVGKAAAEESVAYVVLDLGGDGEPDSAPDPLDFPALKIGASFAKTWPDAETLPEGTHALEVCADVAEEVEESNEDNNCREIKFAVSAPARTSLLLLPLRLVLDAFSTPIRAGTTPSP